MLTLSAFPAAAGDDGEAIFKSQGCTACHRPEKSSKVNPSLADIAQAYHGKEEQLMRYLNGESDAIVKPDKASMMKRYVEKTKTLPASDRKALADFIMQHGEK
jgi:cytochrome c